MELRQLPAFLESVGEPPAPGGFGDGYAKKMSSALAATIFAATLIAIVLRPWKISEALLLQSLDGASTLRQVVRKVGSSLELSRDETSAFSETAIAMAKRLYQLGFLVRSKS